MKASLSFLKRTTFLGIALVFASCGSMQTIKNSTSKVGEGVSSGFGKMGSGVSDGFGKVADLTMSPFRPGVPVVEAREDSLKELPSGQEQALAYQQKQSRGFWSFLGPVDFKEPALPSDGGAMDGGLLPPLE